VAQTIDEVVAPRLTRSERRGEGLGMKAGVAVLALVALGVGSQTALGVCGPPTARTLAVTDSARIYAQPAARGAPVKIVGCHLESGGAPIPLATQLTRRSRVGRRTVVQRLIVQVPRLNGPFAALAVRNFDSLGRGRTTIRVIDLRTGATRFTSRSTAGTQGRRRDWNVTDMVVSSDGRGAWITVFRPDPSQSQVWIRTFAGDQQIDSGLIDPVSLELVETPIETGGIDAGIDYTKQGGTVPGNSSLG